MASDLKTSLVASLETAAAQAGLVLVSVAQGSTANGRPTAIFLLGLPEAEPGGKTLKLELSENFDFVPAASGDRSSSTERTPDLLPQMTAHLAAQAKRLRNPHPECFVTLGGLPVGFGEFEWPFHRSTSGADTHIVHGEIRLADGGTHNLHAKIAASVTLTFAEIVPAMEQPYAETFVYNAVRKTIDLGQLEFLKSGNRQPVPVTTRFWSRWKNTFVFNDTSESERLRFLLTKVYWLSGVQGEGKPVWIADPRDAQYLNTAAEELLRVAASPAAAGLLALDGEFAAATPALMARAQEYQTALESALDFTKPKFNESMRSGQANM
jgi:hypothetical protein